MRTTCHGIYKKYKIKNVGQLIGFVVLYSLSDLIERVFFGGVLATNCADNGRRLSEQMIPSSKFCLTLAASLAIF